jgi:hypothetical protein
VAAVDSDADDRNDGDIRIHGNMSESPPALPVDMLPAKRAAHDLPHPARVGQHQLVVFEQARRVLPRSVDGTG